MRWTLGSWPVHPKQNRSMFYATCSLVLKIINIGQNASNPDQSIATNELVTGNNTVAKLASPTIDDNPSTDTPNTSFPAMLLTQAPAS